VAVGEEPRRVARRAERRREEPQEAREVPRPQEAAAEAVEALPRGADLVDLVHRDPGLAAVRALVRVEDDERAEVQEEVAREERVGAPEEPARRAVPCRRGAAGAEAARPAVPRVRRRRDLRGHRPVSRDVWAKL
jgi:hypothetical protein